MKKSVFALILALTVLLCLGLTACGGGSGGSGESEGIPAAPLKKINLKDYAMYRVDFDAEKLSLWDWELDYNFLQQSLAGNIANITCIKSVEDGKNKYEFKEQGASADSETIYAVAAKDMTFETAVRWMLQRTTTIELQEDHVRYYENEAGITLKWNDPSIERLERILGMEDISVDSFTEIRPYPEGFSVDKDKIYLRVDPFADYDMFFTKHTSGEAGLHRATLYVYDRFERKTQKINVMLPENVGSNLKNGDKVHVSISENILKSAEERYKLEFTRTEADLEVYGLNDYGQEGAKDAPQVTINLKEYVRICPRLGDPLNIKDGFVEIHVDWDRVLRDAKFGLRTNVPVENYGGYTYAEYYAEKIICSVDLICSSHKETVTGMNNLYMGGEIWHLNLGDTLSFTWEKRNKDLAKLEPVLNVDFVCEDFTYTIEEWEDIYEG